MATYIEYTLDDGSTLLVEVDESTEAATKAAADDSGNLIIKAEKQFKDALSSVKTSVKTLGHELSELAPDEVEVTFGIKTTGEAGLFAVCKVGSEMNYEVKLRWGKKE